MLGFEKSRRQLVQRAGALAFLSAAQLTAPLAFSAPTRSDTRIATRGAKVDGVRLSFLDAGPRTDDLTPVILLHGYTQTSHMWRPLMSRIAATRRVIAVDLPGAGDSDRPDTGYDKKSMARLIHGLALQLDMHRVRIAGHDIGLMVAYAYASQYVQEVESIALLDAFLPGVGDWTKVWLLRDKWHFNFYGETPERLVRGRERIYLEHFWNDFAADPKRSVPEPDRRLYAKKYSSREGMRATFGYFKTFEQDAVDFAEFARTPLQQSMLVLTGERASGQFLIEQARLVDTNVKGIIVPGAGHWLMEEAPTQTIGALVDFLTAPVA